MGAPSEVRTLAEKFKQDSAFFSSEEYKEMALRSEFLNPVLRTLGWDPDNPGLAAAHREVTQEASLLIGGKEKAPDYAFFLERRRQFFLEAKRPMVNISTDRASAYQIRRYCWNAGLVLGVVTNFREWAVYDCRFEPHPDDAANVGRIQFFSLDQIEVSWDTFASVFKRDQVASGSLARFADTNPTPRGTQTIDQAFLAEISQWRSLLAKDIAKSNDSIDVFQLNSAVQTLIDRIIFLRIAEDRGYEPFGELKIAADVAVPDIYSRLIALFKRADDRYNSGLFHFSKSKGQVGEPDTFSPDLIVSDFVLNQIIERLYFPHPYEFSVMPADILGRVYEQFLGSRISLNGRDATIDLKPEVRKSGGVYYTPTSIVDYIVQSTIGPLLDGAKPTDIAKMRIVDPACGSGSFLIAAYQYLIDWHTSYYSQGKRNSKAFLDLAENGRLRLKTAERKRILLANLFGVDIDRQAVEVTKLSLLLKLIEGQYQSEFEIGRVLPDLDLNIRCGNSLIDTDFPTPLIATDEDQLDYNPFSWHDQFPTIIPSGGFDAVIGNPPYLSIDATWGRRDPRLAYIKSHYSEIHTDKTDILFYFLALAARISRGEVGFIVSRSFLEADKAQKLRDWLSRNTQVREILDFRDASVFPRVGINTAIIRFSGSKAVTQTRFRRFKDKRLPPGYDATYLRESSSFDEVIVPRTALSAKPWIFSDTTTSAILEKIDSPGSPIGAILHIGQGMQTGSNTAFVIPSTEGTLAAALVAKKMAYKRARNSDIFAFEIANTGPTILYVENVKRYESLPESVRKLLEANETELKARKAFERGNCDWWRYTWPLHKEFIERGRILVPYRAKDNRFAVDESANYLGLTDTTVLYDNDQPEDLHYLAAVLNSKVLNYRFRFIGKLVGGGSYEYFHNTVAKLCVPRQVPGDEVHDQLVKLSKTISKEKTTLRSSRVPAERRRAETRINVAIQESEELVSKLFGLTELEMSAIDNALAQ